MDYPEKKTIDYFNQEIFKNLGDSISNIVPLKSTFQHNIYYLVGNKGLYILKKKKNNEDGSRLGIEYEHLHNIPLHLGPKPLYYNPQKAYIIISYITGKTLKKISINDTDVIEIADKLKNLHSFTQLEGNLIGYNYYLEKIERSKNMFLSIDYIAPYINRENILKIYIYLKKYYSNMSTSSEYKSLIHGDLHGENIIKSPKGQFVIDWESAHYDFPEIDLCSYIFHFDLDKAQILLLLNSYGYDTTSNHIKESLLFFYIFHVFDILSFKLKKDFNDYDCKLIETGITRLTNLLSGEKSLI